MRILINCSNLKIGGGLQVAHSFINQLKSNNEHFFVIILSRILESQIDTSEFGSNFKFSSYDISPNIKKIITGKDFYLNKKVEDEQIETVFSVFGPNYWKPKVRHFAGYAKPQYVYTDSPFFKTLSIFASLKLRVKKVFQMFDFKNNNQLLITENEDVSKRLRVILKNKEIHTITNYYNQVFDFKNEWDNRIKLPAFEGFSLLTISANYPHKNLQIIPKVIHYLNQNYKDFNFRFVLTIDKEELGKNLDGRIMERMFSLGKVNINQCPGLYSQSDAVFLPTLLECFTATYPEAMRMQKPILTSDLNFATGLCKDAAIYFDPLNPKDIGDKIYELAYNKELINNLVLNGENQLKNYDTYVTRAKKYLDIITK